MRYMLDEGWPPEFAPLLNQQFYPGRQHPIVHHIGDLISLRVDDSDWMTELEQRISTHGETWTVITRDKLRIHRSAMSNSALKFAILVDLRWSTARKPELWQALSRYWLLLEHHAVSAPVNVFRLSYSGEISN